MREIERANKMDKLSTRKKGNQSLKKARKNKNDEFYTQLTDVAKEFMHYKKG